MRTTFLVKNRDGKEMTDTPRYILAKKYVRYVGDPILAIVAETLSSAQSIAEKIIIDFEELDCVSNISTAIKKDSPLVREESF